MKTIKKSKNTQLVIAIAVLLAILIFCGAWYVMRNKKEPESTFTDGLGNEQKITNFQECMDWVMPFEEIDGVTYCHAPGNVTFSDKKQ